MTETFTPPPAGGIRPEPPPSGDSSSKKLIVLTVLSVVSLTAALGALGWALLTSTSESKAKPAESSQPAPDPDPVELTPEVVGVSFERPAMDTTPCTGEPLRYSGDQLVDGDENLGWGASKSDAAGATADLRFAGPVKLASVGLTPGYTRVAPRSTEDCRTVLAFPYNRFVQSVRWTFDDGSSVEQTFDEIPELQTLPVDVTTSTVRLTILSTTRPDGAADETVISEAAFTGTP